MLHANPKNISPLPDDRTDNSPDGPTISGDIHHHFFLSGQPIAEFSQRRKNQDWLVSDCYCRTDRFGDVVRLWAPPSLFDSWPRAKSR